MKNKEIEVKFQISDKTKLKKKLEALGGKKRNKVFQKTYSLFQPNYECIKRGVFLRVREDDGIPVFTVKIKSKESRDFYERDEYNLEIKDTQKMIKMLSLLGFSKIRIFEKYREAWDFPARNACVLIDTLPFANFVEIEGDKKDIEKIIEELGFRGERITWSYWTVYEEFCQKNGLIEENDIVFNS
jgi:adenylate cyclase class 2